MLSKDPEQQALSAGLGELGLRKLLLDNEAVHAVASERWDLPVPALENFQRLTKRDQYEYAADVFARQQADEPPEVTARLRPHRLVHQVQQSIISSESTVNNIIAEGPLVVPLLIGLLRGVAQDYLHDDGVAVMVCDGLGHGPLAAEAAGRAVAVFDAAPREDAAAMIERAHRALSGSRGAAMAVATLGGGRLRYAGAGNIAGVISGGERGRGLPSQNGTVGLQIRRVQALDYDWPAGARLFMHSDGLSNRWTLESYPGLGSRHPSIQAAVLWRDCARGRDDATIVVVGRRTAGHA